MNQGYWSETRANGDPIEAGTFCWVTEMEGINPIYTYGKTKDEVIEKLSRTNAHAQAAMARRTPPTPITETPAQPAKPRPALTADQIFQATADLQNPGKAGEAAARLIGDATGLDLNQLALDQFARLAMTWQAEHPDFYPHPANKRLLAQDAAAFAGGLSRVTKEILTQTFNNLRQGGYLVSEPISDPNDPPPQPQPTFPGESPVQRTERPRGASFATHVPGNRSRAPQRPQPPAPKYTEAQIRSMPERQYRELIESNDPDFNAACELYFGTQQSA